MPKFSQNIYKSIKLKDTENQIDWVIQVNVVKISLQEGGGEGMGGGGQILPPPPPLTNRVKNFKTVMVSFYRIKNSESRKKVIESFFSIKNFNSCKAVVEFFLSLKSFNPGKRMWL